LEGKAGIKPYLPISHKNTLINGGVKKFLEVREALLKERQHFLFLLAL
jgi:hypothetical protein